MIDAGSLSSLGATFEGEVVVPGAAGYDAARVVWNGLIDRRPAAIVRPSGPDDVAIAIRFARDHDLAIAVRGGGHSVGGFSTCDDGLVIDLSRMRGVAVDPERRIARANGGALLSELDFAAQEHDLVCPVGVVGHTGVAGLTLGGGMGRLQRRFGFTVDNLLAVELVTAEGARLRVSDDEHPDLFWGIRGAGANFGVVTSFEYRLHPFDGSIAHGFLAFAGDRVFQVLERVLGFLADAPDELFVSTGFEVASVEEGYPADVAGQPSLYLAPAYSGDPDRVEDVLRPLRDLGPAIDTVDRKRYLDVQSMSDEAMAWGKRFYTKGAFLAELSDGFVERGLASIETAPSAGCAITAWNQGGAISRLPDDAMAFNGRRASFWIAVETEWDDGSDDDAHIAWGRSTMAGLQPFTIAGHYVNDVVESGDDVVRSIYGPAKYERLVGLKRAYDPDNVFRLNQNVRP